jgi:hypothetical protein
MEWVDHAVDLAIPCQRGRGRGSVAL